MTEEPKQADDATTNEDDPAAEGSEAGPEAAAEAPAAAPVDPLEEARAEATQLKEKLMRTAADFDNYRKRSRRELVDAEKKGRDNLLKDLLPVFDNLERATAHASQDGEVGETAKGLVDGISLVVRQFRDALSRLGIERVESVGQPFDPGVHEAIQHLETADVPPGHIAAEVQPGYKDVDRLLRPALVVVAKAPAEPVAKDAQGDASGEASASSEESEQSGTGQSPEA